MAEEIERKFLVIGDIPQTGGAVRAIPMMQAYLSTHPERVVRLRIAGEEAWLTVKGKPREGGVSRGEWEYPIPVQEAREMLPLCEPGRIEKTRYEIPFAGHLWEVDLYEGALAGLRIAEIELTAEEESFTPPPWVGREVSGDRRFYNSGLAKLTREDVLALGMMNEKGE